VAAVLAVVLAAAAACTPATPSGEAVDRAPSSAPATRPVDATPAARATPLAGRVVVLDPGHQLGNARHPAKINRLVPAGPQGRKPCNTTGTSTNAGYPEATFVWRVATRVQRRLTRLGARVVLTRHSNRLDRWGPCVDARGRAGNRLGADLKVSLHADGSYAAGARGFHVIAPERLHGWTDDIARPSLRAARVMRTALRRHGFPVSTYLGRRGLDRRGDLATLNLSDVPTVMLELGNMRNARDARAMTRPRGQARYARAVVAGVRTAVGGR